MPISNKKCFICFPFKTNALYVKGSGKDLGIWLTDTDEPNFSFLYLFTVIENISEKFFY